MCQAHARSHGSARLEVSSELTPLRSGANEKARAWANGAGSHASLGTFADAAAFGDMIVLAFKLLRK